MCKLTSDGYIENLLTLAGTGGGGVDAPPAVFLEYLFCLLVECHHFFIESESESESDVFRTLPVNWLFRVPLTVDKFMALYNISHSPHRYLSRYSSAP